MENNSAIQENGNKEPIYSFQESLYGLLVAIRTLEHSTLAQNILAPDQEKLDELYYKASILSSDKNFFAGPQFVYSIEKILGDVFDDIQKDDALFECQKEKKEETDTSKAEYKREYPNEPKGYKNLTKNLLKHPTRQAISVALKQANPKDKTVNLKDKFINTLLLRFFTQTRNQIEHKAIKKSDFIKQGKALFSQEDNLDYLFPLANRTDMTRSLMDALVFYQYFIHTLASALEKKPYTDHFKSLLKVAQPYLPELIASHKALSTFKVPLPETLQRFALTHLHTDKLNQSIALQQLITDLKNRPHDSINRAQNNAENHNLSNGCFIYVVQTKTKHFFFKKKEASVLYRFGEKHYRYILSSSEPDNIISNKNLIESLQKVASQQSLFKKTSRATASFSSKLLSLNIKMTKKLLHFPLQTVGKLRINFLIKTGLKTLQKDPSGGAHQAQLINLLQWMLGRVEMDESKLDLTLTQCFKLDSDTPKGEESLAPINLMHLNLIKILIIWIKDNKDKTLQAIPSTLIKLLDSEKSLGDMSTLKAFLRSCDNLLKNPKDWIKQTQATLSEKKKKAAHQLDHLSPQWIALEKDITQAIKEHFPLIYQGLSFLSSGCLENTIEYMTLMRILWRIQKETPTTGLMDAILKEAPSVGLILNLLTTTGKDILSGNCDNIISLAQSILLKGCTQLKNHSLKSHGVTLDNISLKQDSNTGNLCLNYQTTHTKNTIQAEQMIQQALKEDSKEIPAQNLNLNTLTFPSVEEQKSLMNTSFMNTSLKKPSSYEIVPRQTVENIAEFCSIELQKPGQLTQTTTILKQIHILFPLTIREFLEKMNALLEKEHFLLAQALSLLIKWITSEGKDNIELNKQIERSALACKDIMIYFVTLRPIKSLLGWLKTNKEKALSFGIKHLRYHLSKSPLSEKKPDILNTLDNLLKFVQILEDPHSDLEALSQTLVEEIVLCLNELAQQTADLLDSVLEKYRPWLRILLKPFGNISLSPSQHSLIDLMTSEKNKTADLIKQLLPIIKQVIESLIQERKKAAAQSKEREQKTVEEREVKTTFNKTPILNSLAPIPNSSSIKINLPSLNKDQLRPVTVGAITLWVALFILLEWYLAHVSIALFISGIVIFSTISLFLMTQSMAHKLVKFFSIAEFLLTPSTHFEPIKKQALIQHIHEKTLHQSTTNQDTLPLTILKNTSFHSTLNTNS